MAPSKTQKQTDKNQVGGYYVKNNGMVREVVHLKGRVAYAECAGHGGKDGPDGDKGVDLNGKGGDVFFVPKGDRNLHGIVQSNANLMKYNGPLVGQTVHVQLPGEVRHTARLLTAGMVGKFDKEMLTRTENKRISDAA